MYSKYMAPARRRIWHVTNMVQRSHCLKLYFCDDAKTIIRLAIQSPTAIPSTKPIRDWVEIKSTVPNDSETMFKVEVNKTKRVSPNAKAGGTGSARPNLSLIPIATKLTNA